MSNSANAEVCHRAAGKLGPIWKLYRKKLPPAVRDLFAELLLEIRHHVVPSSMLSPADNIGNSRYDIHGISQLFVHLANVPAEGDAWKSDCRDLPPPPPPPPLPSEGTAADNRELNAPTILKLEEHFDVCRTDEVCFESLLNYFDLDDSETNCLEVPVLDVFPSDLGEVVGVTSGTNCTEDTKPVLLLLRASSLT